MARNHKFEQFAASSHRTIISHFETAPEAKRKARSPVEILFGMRDADTPLMIYRATQKGVEFRALKEMVSRSSLFSTAEVLIKITGQSRRSLQRMALAADTAPNEVHRLTPQQSTVAYQFAQVLEHATEVFGTQELAEQWLTKPCKYLDGIAPLELIDNALGFQAVEDYLERVKLGVYQ